jgi:hypothetical protein
MTETTITVHGEYDIHHPAERGTVSLTLGFEGPERAPVLALTTTLHTRVSDSVRSLTDPVQDTVTWWSSDQARV